MTETTRPTRTRKLVAAAAVAVAAALGTTAAAGGTGGSAPSDEAGRRVPHIVATEFVSAAAPIDLADAIADEGDLKVFHRAGEAPNGSGTGTWSNMAEFLETVLFDADSYWTSVFTAAGLAEPWVNYEFPEPGQVATTACNPGYSDDNSMFYCPADDKIVFSQSIATRLWDGSYVGPDGQALGFAGGDFAVAFLVGHEFAHSIQSETRLNTMGFSVPQLEKHADCWSGVWARSASDRGLLDDGDVQEGLNGAFLVGDSHFESPSHHGTSAQRMEAFAIGFDSAAPASCDVFLQ